MNKPIALALLLLLLAGCSSNQAPPADPSPPTAIDSFGANPNPAPANIPVNFSWSVTGDDLTCAVDVDNNGTNEYTVQDCSSSSRIGHVYGVQGSFTAQLTVTGADGVTLRKTTAVKLEVENQAPSVLSFDVRQGSKENSIIFAWTVSDSGADTLRCRLDADGDGKWEMDQFCSRMASSVGALAVSSSQVEVTLPTGTYLSIFEVYDAYSTTRITKGSRSPLNRRPQITSLTTVAGSNLSGIVSFQVSDPDRDQMTCSLTVQGIGQFAYQNCASLTRSYTFPKEGTYQVRLEVIDTYQGVASMTTEITFQTTPPPVPLQLTALGDNTCSLTGAGAAYCWGNNAYGQLGIGTSGGGTDQNTPQAVSMPSGVTFTQLDAAEEHACGLTGAGAAYCWGRNNLGQLGLGNTNSPQTTPQAVSMPSGVTFTRLTSGQRYTCGLTAAGAAYCWGQNSYGQLGLGNEDDQSIPQAVSMPGGVTFTQLATGYSHACGLTAAGAAYCWGKNDYGQLGLGNTDNQNTPQAVSMPGGVTFTQLFMGNAITCGLTGAGVAYCWGKNSKGQLGIGNEDAQNTPQAVLMPSGVTFTQLAAGGSHTCGLTATGAAYCWGYNQFGGQLGLGNEDNQNTPQAVLMPSGVTFTQLATGSDHTCGASTTGAAYCWGRNFKGQLGLGTNGDGTNQNTPQKVVGFP